MSIISAKRAAQNGFGDLGQVLSGTMRYDNSAEEQVYTFLVAIKGEAEPRQYLFRVKKGVSWEIELARRGRIAADMVREDKAKGAAA